MAVLRGGGREDAAALWHCWSSATTPSGLATVESALLEIIAAAAAHPALLIASQR